MAKRDALDIAQERHLLEVAFYDQPHRGNTAVGMWGQQEVDEQLAEYEHYKALARE